MPDAAKTVLGCEVSTGNTTFVISKHRTFSDGTLSFNVSDEENRCLSTISGIENAAFLKENAKLRLGLSRVIIRNIYLQKNKVIMSWF